ILAPLNTALRGPALEHALSLVEPRIVVSEQSLHERLDRVAVASAGIRWELTVNGEPPAEGETYPGPGETTPAEPVQPGDAAALLFTSGTTGPSKAVICPHGQWFWWGVIVSELLELREEDVLYTNLPLFHTNAMSAFYQALLTGATIHVGPRFSGSRYWDRVRQADATVGYLLGTMAHVLVKRDPQDDDRSHRLRVALAPGTKADVAIEFHERFGVELVDAWGATEANAAIGAACGEAPPGTMGHALDGFEARVVDQDGIELPDGVPGELVLRSTLPFAFSSGYFGMPEATVEAWRDLWLHTGDRVVRRDGVYAFVDRLKDAIRRRGENISAWEVEQVLLAHASVTAAAVVGVPAELGEEEVLAFVVPRTGEDVDPGDLIRFCEPLMPDFALPSYVEVLSGLPLTPSGRVEKYRLRERGLTPSTWDRVVDAR
ncbi:MAG TPA: AMP-binding protein, partial [Gaiellaceae bacterium]|nr:AMP-binding protein [Gaiellaceae bacterium]